MNLILIVSLVSMIWLLNSLEGCYFIELLVRRLFLKMCRLYPVKHVFVLNNHNVKPLLHSYCFCRFDFEYQGSSGGADVHWFMR